MTRTSSHNQESRTNRDQILPGYLEYLRIERSFSPDSIAAYRGDLLKMFCWIDKRGLDCVSVSFESLAAFIRDLESVLANSTVIRIVSAVKSFYEYLVIDRYLVESPARFLARPVKDEVDLGYLTAEEMELLLEQPGYNFEGCRDRAILQLFYSTGLRVSELAGLTYADVDLDERILKCFGKGGKARMMPIGREAITEIETYQASMEEAGIEAPEALFITRKGKKLNRQYIYELVAKYADQAGLLNVTPHTLRHTYATELLAGGADVRDVQILLGHSSLSSTQIYTHVSEKALRNSYEQNHPRA
jgi:integrase/recombinase XerD